MFDRLFQRPRVLARHRKGPLAEERRRYLAHGAEQEMALLTLQNMARYTLVVAKALRLADRPGEFITKDEIEVEAERWANRQPKPSMMRLFHHSRRNFKGHAIRWLTFLGGCSHPPPSSGHTPSTLPSSPTTSCGNVGCRPKRSRIAVGRFTSFSRKSRELISG